MSKPDCRTCGACCVCFEDQTYFCDVTWEDMERLSKRFVQTNIEPTISIAELLYHRLTGKTLTGAIKTKWEEVKTGPLAGYKLNTCVALRGSVMSRVSCRVYKNRPNTCRIAVKPGDRACLEVRQAFKQAIKDCT
jgi:Fe-S-cluster containining protein